ncbi:translin isoform X1 [Pseudoliparis swirei]|uniref:translin isoform X1 n=1 Tax=Pseudoliparis swirei TaxID=2059687 RepID=UPI0024BEF348|nr:translin isoform X1 [Pseudoliparis swirei]
MSVTEMFSSIQGSLSADQDIREDIRKVVQTLEQTGREILTVLQSVHQTAGFKEIPSKCERARELFCTVRTQIAELKTKFPTEQYYRFHEHWRFVLQRLAFLATFVVYLETETLVVREEVAKILGIEVVREKGFHLDVEDYLAGVLIMASELVRIELLYKKASQTPKLRLLRFSAILDFVKNSFFQTSPKRLVRIIHNFLWFIIGSMPSEIMFERLLICHCF